jgi:hypothetical protein
VLKVALTATITAIVCFGIAVTAGLGATKRSEEQFNAGVGDYIFITSLDLSCKIVANSPTAGEPGPQMYCFRNSTANGKNNLSAEVAITRFHIYLSPSHSSKWTNIVARTP